MNEEKKVFTAADIAALPEDTASPQVVSGSSDPAQPSIPSIPEEHKTYFIKNFGDALYNGFINTGLRAGGAVQGMSGDLGDVIGTITGLNSFQNYRKNFVEDPQAWRAKAQELTATDNLAENSYYSLVDSIATLPIQIPIDVMTGQALRLTLAGRVLPQMETLLSGVKDFSLGMGFRGMVDAVNKNDGGLVEKTVAGVVGGAESMAFGELFASAGPGLKGIGKLAAIGLAQTFYSAGKEGRIPSKEEMVEGITTGGMLGFVFAALPHIVEGSQNKQEKATLRAYHKKMADAIEPKDIRTYEIKDSGIDLSVYVNPNLLKGMSQQDISNSAPYGEPTTVLGKQIAEKLGKNYEQLKLLSLAGKDVEIRRDARKMLHIISDRVIESFKQDRLANFDPESGLFKSLFPKQNITISDPTSIPNIISDIATDERIRPEIRESLLRPLLSEIESRGDIAPMDFKLGNWKDPSKLAMYRETMERIIEWVARPSAKEVQADTTEMIKVNEALRHRWESRVAQVIREEFAPKGIKPNSLDSALMMRYGEGRMTEAELQKASPKNWQNIKTAAERCRGIYDETLDELNKIRKAVGKDPIAKVPDYFRHFQDISAVDQLFGHFFGEGDGRTTPTATAGIINRTHFKSPFNPTEMKRLGNNFTEDGVLALQNYAKAVSNQLFHTDSVQRIRQLEKYIRTQAQLNETALQEGRPYVKVDLSNFVGKLKGYADLLAGQPTGLTQWVNEMFMSTHPLDRVTAGLVQGLRRNVALNMIAWNVGAGTMNILPLAQQLATTRSDCVAKGWTTSGLHLLREKSFEMDGARSEFYDRRYPTGFLPANWYEAIVDKGYVFSNFVDRMAVQALIAGKYFEGKEQGLSPKDAMKAADNYAVRVVTDRTTGQTPGVMSEPSLKAFSMFQVEINNLWSWLAHDIPKDRQLELKGKIGRIAIFALASTIINNVYEKTQGRRPQLDFLYILGTLAGLNKSGSNRPFVERLKPAMKDFFGNVPFGNLVLDGGRFPMASAMPDLKKATEDPEVAMLREFLKPLWFLNPLGGGSQIRKTTEGLTSWAAGYVASPSGKTMRYQVQKDIWNFMRGFLFGKNSFPEAVEHWDKPKG